MLIFQTSDMCVLPSWCCMRSDVSRHLFRLPELWRNIFKTPILSKTESNTRRRRPWPMHKVNLAASSRKIKAVSTFSTLRELHLIGMTATSTPQPAKAPSPKPEPQQTASTSTASPAKPENQAMLDFFSSIEQEQTPMFNPQTGR